MPLEDYRIKRKFTETPEPAGRSRRNSHRRIFVVQKHDASRLHYDVRLAINRVLVSWAVPKGPSMNPAEKRLGIRTEDHPLEYAEFEGVIGNTPSEQLARGKIDVVLHGTKLRGGFTLFRTGMRPADVSQKERWLLVKHRDEFADPSWDIESPRFDRSALTGRSLKEIENDRPRKMPRLGHAHL